MKLAQDDKFIIKLVAILAIPYALAAEMAFYPWHNWLCNFIGIGFVIILSAVIIKFVRMAREVKRDWELNKLPTIILPLARTTDER